ncbi:DUF455 family protein, partial [Rhizobium ruizarguesonis]
GVTSRPRSSRISGTTASLAVRSLRVEWADVLDVIYNDEKGHVAVGAKWFRLLCAREKRDPAKAFQELVRANFSGPLKPTFNDLARAEAGLTPS